MDWHDEQNVPGDFEKQTLTVFKSAIIRYIQCLEPLKAEGNHTINKEIEDWNAILQRINQLIKGLTNDNEMDKLNLLGKNYGKLFDILWKHYNAKKQLLEEKKKLVLEEAAHEGATGELEEINRVLQFGFWNHVTRHKALVDSFYPKEEPKKDSPNVQMQITIGNLYGQFAAFNNGTMVQNNNTEAVTALREITDALIASKLPDQEKQEALLDVEAMQSQLKKEKPNKKMLEIGLSSLQVAANIAQIASVVAPHFDKIQHFIASLPH